MEQKVSNIARSIKANFIKVTVLIASGILLATACEKSQPPTGNANSMNDQEQTLTGTWQLQRSETYEITGTDSTGQLVGTLIGSSDCDSLCHLMFRKNHSGAGSLGACDSTSSFTWNARQPYMLEIGQGIYYNLVYLSADSVAFSSFYIKDILKLKSVWYYKRN